MVLFFGFAFWLVLAWPAVAQQTVVIAGNKAEIQFYNPATNYTAFNQSSVALGSVYAKQRDANKGLVIFPCKNFLRAKTFTIPKNSIQSIVRIKYIQQLPEYYDYVFLKNGAVYQVYVSSANGSIFITAEIKKDNPGSCVFYAPAFQAAKQYTADANSLQNAFAQLQGTWKFISKSGGLAGIQKQTPIESHFIAFQNHNYSEAKTPDSALTKGRFELNAQRSIYSSNSIFVGLPKGLQFVLNFVGKDTLYLKENHYDGFSYGYSRVAVVKRGN